MLKPGYATDSDDLMRGDTYDSKNKINARFYRAKEGIWSLEDLTLSVNIELSTKRNFRQLIQFNVLFCTLNHQTIPIFTFKKVKMHHHYLL